MSTSVARGEWIDPALAGVTVGDWAASWLALQVQLKPSTRERYAVALRRQILPTWSTVAIGDMTHAAVSTWVSDLTESHLSPASVRYAHRVLALLLDHAIRDRRILGNPASGVRLPRTVATSPTFLSHRQVHQLADAAGDYRTLILTLAYNRVALGRSGGLAGWSSRPEWPAAAHRRSDGRGATTRRLRLSQEPSAALRADFTFLGRTA